MLKKKKKAIWDDIEKFSLFYAMLKGLVGFFQKRYYKGFVIRGFENIDDNKPIIFAPTHQNSLMDALGILAFVKDQPIFLARADFFKKAFIIRLLKFCNIMPVFRIRDGINTLQQNNEIFDKAIEILLKNKKLIVLPEGSHADIHRLRPLKKGISRIAFQALEKSNYQLDIRIIPVAIDYYNYRKFYQPALIVFGKPVLLKNFIENHRTNPQKAHNELLAELSTQLKKIMVHIGNQEYYNLYDNLRELYKFEMMKHLGFQTLHQPNKLKTDKVLIQVLDNTYKKVPQAFEDLNKKTNSYIDGLKKFNLRNWIFNKEKYNYGLIILQSVFQVITFPIFAYGLINNFLPYYLPVRAVKNLKDPQFFSSIKFVIATFGFPIFYILQTILVGVFTNPAWLPWVYLLSLPVTFYFALYYYFWIKKLRAKIVYNKNRKAEEFRSLIKTRGEIFELLDQWVKEEFPQIDRSDYWDL